MDFIKQYGYSIDYETLEAFHAQMTTEPMNQGFLNFFESASNYIVYAYDAAMHGIPLEQRIPFLKKEAAQ